jgi:hypothetical protein
MLKKFRLPKPRVCKLVTAAGGLSRARTKKKKAIWANSVNRCRLKVIKAALKRVDVSEFASEHRN